MLSLPHNSSGLEDIGLDTLLTSRPEQGIPWNDDRPWYWLGLWYVGRWRGRGLILEKQQAGVFKRLGFATFIVNFEDFPSSKHVSACSRRAMTGAGRTKPTSRSNQVSLIADLLQACRVPASLAGRHEPRWMSTSAMRLTKIASARRAVCHLQEQTCCQAKRTNVAGGSASPLPLHDAGNGSGAEEWCGSDHGAVGRGGHRGRRNGGGPRQGRVSAGVGGNGVSRVVRGVGVSGLEVDISRGGVLRVGGSGANVGCLGESAAKSIGAHIRGGVHRLGEDRNEGGAASDVGGSRVGGQDDTIETGGSAGVDDGAGVAGVAVTVIVGVAVLRVDHGGRAEKQEVLELHGDD
nr:hypothetical protein CFP56_11805 [Quercus suber]